LTNSKNLVFYKRQFLKEGDFLKKLRKGGEELWEDKECKKWEK